MSATRIIINGQAVDIGGMPVVAGNPGQLIGIGEDGAAKATVYPNNDNLLINWYLIGGGSQQEKDNPPVYGCFPVNQRSEKEYSAGSDLAVYGIDKWLFIRGRLKLTSDGILFSATNATTPGWFGQRFEADIIGKTVTFSAIIDGELYYLTGVYQSSGALESSWMNDLQLSLTYDSNKRNVALIWSRALNQERKIKAAKLELGDQQTLAHKEGDEWVLNAPPPNYALELARCRMYQKVLNSIGHKLSAVGIGIAPRETRAYIMIDTGPRRTSSPSVSSTGSWVLSNLEASAKDIAVTSITNDATNNSEENILLLCQTEGGLVPNSPYILRPGQDQQARIILDYNL